MSEAVSLTIFISIDVIQVRQSAAKQKIAQ